MGRRRNYKSGLEILALDNIAIRWGDRVQFTRTRWRWRRGEQWAVLGPNGAGKSVLALALRGKAAVVRGEIRYHFEAAGEGPLPEVALEERVALVSPHTQRELVTQEGSFYQSRWHSGISEGQRTVAQFLSQASVEEHNPFEIGARKGSARLFRQRRRRYVRWLGIGHLLRRKLIHLSNGEQRKVLLAHTLLRAPKLLILDDPFGGLDTATRGRLKRVIERLMRGGLPVLVLTSRPDEIPPDTTHILLVRGHRVIGQGSKGVMLRHPLARRLARRQQRDDGRAGATNARVIERAARSGARVRAAPAIAEVEFSRTRTRDEDESGARAVRGKGQGSGKGPLASRARRAVGPPLIELNRVTIQSGRKRILDDVTWTVRRGETWALLGPNGSGKTTLLSLIQGDHPRAYALDLRLFGARPHSTQTLWQTRQQIGWVSPELHLHYPVSWSSLAVVCSGFFNTVGLYQSVTTRQRANARAWLREFHLEEKADEAFGELSLGDQRLVLLARAVVRQPKLLILDEPCQGLDAAHRQAVLGEVDRLIKKTGASLIFVTHQAQEMPECVKNVVTLKAGRVAQLSRGN